MYDHLDVSLAVQSIHVCICYVMLYILNDFSLSYIAPLPNILACVVINNKLLLSPPNMFVIENACCSIIATSVFVGISLYTVV